MRTARGGDDGHRAGSGGNAARRPDPRGHRRAGRSRSTSPAGAALKNALRAAAALAAVVALTCCARSQESRIRDAIAAKFPDGPRRCLGLTGDVVGVRLPAVAGANYWFPSSGPASPLRHAFLFYAAPAADPVPELVGTLAAAGGLRRTMVDWRVDTETSGPGPEVVGTVGYRYWPDVFHHGLAVTPVALYETEPQPAEFDHHTEFNNSDPPSRPPSRLPSRRNGDTLLPADVHHRVPVVVPRAPDVVTAACYPERVVDVSDVHALHGWDGSERVEATVTFDPHPSS